MRNICGLTMFGAPRWEPFVWSLEAIGGTFGAVGDASNCFSGNWLWLISPQHNLFFDLQSNVVYLEAENLIFAPSPFGVLPNAVLNGCLCLFDASMGGQVVEILCRTTWFFLLLKLLESLMHQLHVFSWQELALKTLFHLNTTIDLTASDSLTSLLKLSPYSKWL